MPPDSARQQSTALARVDRLQRKEDKARKQHELQKSKSDSTLKQMAAKAAKDGKANKAQEEVNGGKASQKDGTPAAGPMQGGKGMGPHKKNPIGDKSTKEAAKFAVKLAAESKKSQLPPDVQGVNEAPQVELTQGATDGGKAAEGAGDGAAAGAAAGAGGGGAAAASGGGSTDEAKALTNAPPAEFAKKISETGKKITDAASKEVSAKNEAMPDFTAKMSGETDLSNDGSVERVAGDDSISKGGIGEDASSPNLKKELRVRTGKQKPGSDIKGAGTDAGAEALKSLFSASLGKIETSSTVNASPGPAPTVQLSGESDPSRANEEQEEANQKSDASYVKHVEAINAGPGPEVVKPLHVQEAIPAANIELPPIPDVGTPAEAADYLSKGHDAQVYDKADELQAGKFDEALAEAEGQFEQAGDNLDTDHASKVDEASKAVDDENTKAQEKQEAEVNKARGDIDKGRSDTKKAQEGELKKAKKAGDKQRKSAQGKIEKRRKDDDKKISKKFKEGEKKAAQKKKTAEKKAAAKKKEADAKKSDESWWSRAASAVGSFIDSVANAVSGIFDAMAKAVGSILNAVKDAAMGMIDAAISFATAALDVLGDALKSLVTNLLGDIFPGLASALNDLIDSAVNMAKDAVNAIGEQLKAAVAAAIDGLNGAIQAVINAYKAAVATALAIASAAVTGDWEGALKAMLEGALSLAGIPAAEFYRVVGDGMDTINAIIDDPGSFVGNMIDAVGNGFGQFADNFGTHLMDGAIEWMTGSLGEAGLTLPETWDAGGIFGLVLDILGLGYDSLKGKVEERIGEENMAMLESVWGYVEAALDGGLAGLWDHAKDQVGNIWQGVLDAALGFLMEKVVVAAVTKIASMFNPAGAIIQAVLMAWNVYNFVQEQAARIMGLVTSVVDSMTQIVAGQLGPAANFIEGSLSDLVPVAISLLANLLGLGGVSAKVKEIIENLQETVGGGVDFVLDKLFELGKSAFDAIAGVVSPGEEDPAAEAANAEETPAQAGGDPAQLPGMTLATTSGAIQLGWDAVAGGQSGNTKMTGGSYAGNVGAVGIGKMETAAAALEGPAKTEADRFIGAAKTQALSLDSRGGKYIRGEDLDLGPLRAGFDTLSAALLEGANVLDSANTSGLEAGQLPPAATFSDAHGHSHRVWAEAENGVPKLMVASTPIRVQDQVKAWRDIRDAMVAPEKGAFESLLSTTVALEQECETLAAQVAAGTAGASGLAAKQAQLAQNINDLFSVTSATDDFAGVDPRDTLLDPQFGQFKTKYAGFAAEVGMSGAAAEAEVIWLAAVQSMQRTLPDYRKVKLLTPKPGEFKRQLGSKAMEAVIADFDPLIDAMRPLMDLWTGQNQGKKWAFWSGKPASTIAKSASGWIALESSPLGAMFDGLSMDSTPRPNNSGDMGLWSSLSNAYAEYLAGVVETAAELGGFVGMGATGVENTYMGVERKAVVKILGHSKAAALDFNWFACLSVSGDPNEPDRSHKVAGIDGVILSTKDRNAAIAKAEEEGRKIHPWGDAPHTHLLMHLQENSQASSAFDSNLMSKLETVTPPDSPTASIDDTEPYVLHARPTLNALFNRSSSVGTSLSDDLKNIEVTKSENGMDEVRGFEEDSPYLTPLRADVANGLKSSVRSPTIRDGVLQRANPTIPGSAKAAITTWLTNQPSRGTPPATRDLAQLPRHSYTNAGGQDHELYVDGGGNVTQASNNPKEVKKTQQGKAFQLAGQVEEMTKAYLAGEDNLEQIKTAMGQLKTEMAAARGEIDEAILVKKRLALEQKLGAHAFGHSASNGAATDLADKSWKLLEGLGDQMMTKAAKIDTDLLKDGDLNTFEPFREMVTNCGMDLGAGFFGSVGKSYDRIKQVFKSGNLREKVQHVVNFSGSWAKQVFKQGADDVQKLLSDAGVAEEEIRKVMAARDAQLAKPADKQKLDKKGLYGSTEGNDEYAEAKGSDMDRKFPAVPLEALSRDELVALARRFGMKPRDTTPTDRILRDLKKRQTDEKTKNKYIAAGTSGGGESNPTTLSPRGRETDIGLSGRESEAHGLDGKLPFLEGMLANMVDSNNAWIKEANDLEMPLRAGVSGTTHRWMNFAAQLGANLPGSRLAMLGHLIPTNAHSFHEIMVAAQGHVSYEQGKYTPLDPITGDMRKLALDAGAEANEVDAILGISPNA